MSHVTWATPNYATQMMSKLEDKICHILIPFAGFP